MQTIKLMADYGCLPLWDEDDVGEIDPDDLAISVQLKTDLMAWADEYDAALSPEDGTLVGFPDEVSRRLFNQQGHVLYERLKQELGAEAQVQYVAPFE
ncbi:MAG: hypothetical protein U5M23_04295 [Marinagarivorans sp.]|nr:hypothetical protein [Marinagarivorans sp.]